MEMNFFIGRGLSKYLSGIEQSQLRRLKLFKKNKQPAKILFIASNANLHEQIKQYHIDDDDFIDLFEYYQGTAEMPNASFGIDDFLVGHSNALVKDLGIDRGVHGYDIFEDSKLRWQVRVNVQTNQVQYVFSVKNNKSEQIEMYDSRGFLTSRLKMNSAGIVTQQDYLTPNGKVAISIKYKDYQKNTITGIDLPLKQKHFKKIAELYTDFFDRLNQDYKENNLFFYDRDVPLDSLFDMQTPRKAVIVVHNNHEQAIKPPKDGVKPKYPTFYAQLFAEYETYPFDKIIVATEQQRQDIISNYKLAADRIVTIPVSWMSEQNKVAETDRVPHSIIMVNRIAPEKRIMDVIKAFERVVKSVPDATLKIYGNAVGTRAEEIVAQVNQYILQHDLFGKAQFAGFTTLLDSRYDKATIGVMTSTVEGFNIAMLEELNHGIPVVSYDIKYGPQDMIIDGQDGYLVPEGDIEELASRLIQIMNNPLLANQLSQGAYQMADKFSEKSVWAKWQQLLKSLNALK